MASKLNIVILAAGKGTRMKSKKLKVLHPLAGSTVIEQILTTGKQLSPDKIIMVYGHQGEQLQSHLKEHGIDSKVHYEYVLGDLPIGQRLTKPDLLGTSVMLSRGVLSLPMYPELTDEEVSYISDKVRLFFDK